MPLLICVLRTFAYYIPLDAYEKKRTSLTEPSNMEANVSISNGTSFPLGGLRKGTTSMGVQILQVRLRTSGKQNEYINVRAYSWST